MFLTVLDILYIVLIVFTTIIWTLLIIVLLRLIKILWPIVEIAEFYEKIKLVLVSYAYIPEIIKEKIASVFKKEEEEEEEVSSS